MLDNFKLLVTIAIPNYLREVRISKAQNPKYFEWDGVTIKAKSKKIWKKLLKKGKDNKIVTPTDLADNCCIVGFKGKSIYSFISSYTGLEQTYLLTAAQNKKKLKYIVCIKDKQGDISLEYPWNYSKVIANPTQAGKPNDIVVTGQKGYYGIHTQNKIVSELMDSYLKKFNTIIPKSQFLLKKLLNENAPIWIVLEIQDTVKAWNDNSKDDIGRPWDVDNRALPYLKTFKDFLVRGYTNESDVLVQEPILEDDDRLRVMGDASIFTPIDDIETRKLKFHFYTDTRDVWNKYKKL